MSELTDLLLQTTDPVNAVILIGILLYIRGMKDDVDEDLSELKENLKEDLRRHRQRINRVENQHMTDGGPEHDDHDS